MTKFTLSHKIHMGEAQPHEQVFDNLIATLRAAWHAQLATGQAALEKLDKDGEPYLDTKTLRACVGRVGDYQNRGQSFEQALEAVAREIERARPNT